MPASSVEYGTRTRSCKNSLSTFAIYRHLSPSIALKRKFLAVDMTVSQTCPDDKCCNFHCLSAPETIEWE
jgi:hypothetical protein